MKISLFLIRLLNRPECLAVAWRKTAVGGGHAGAVTASAAAELVSRLLVTAFASFDHDNERCDSQARSISPTSSCDRKS